MPAFCTWRLKRRSTRSRSSPLPFAAKTHTSTAGQFARNQGNMLQVGAMSTPQARPLSGDASPRRSGQLRTETRYSSTVVSPDGTSMLNRTASADSFS